MVSHFFFAVIISCSKLQTVLLCLSTDLLWIIKERIMIYTALSPMHRVARKKVSVETSYNMNDRSISRCIYSVENCRTRLIRNNIVLTKRKQRKITLFFSTRILLFQFCMSNSRIHEVLSPYTSRVIWKASTKSFYFKLFRHVLPSCAVVGILSCVEKFCTVNS